jgi:hypothetical protein
MAIITTAEPPEPWMMTQERIFQQLLERIAVLEKEKGHWEKEAQRLAEECKRLYNELRTYNGDDLK